MFLKENIIVHFPKRILTISRRKRKNQIIKKQSITTQSTLSMKAKTKSKPISLLNVNENVLSNHQANEKHQALDSQPISGSQPNRHTQLLKSKRMKIANKSQETKVKLQRTRKTLKP
jgi:hypothetical protein